MGKCDTVCKEPVCHTECTNPQPKCESVCEEPLCDWKCHRPSDCQKPKCALVCEQAPHCQPQPPVKDCCACDASASGAEGAAKCCSCNATPARSGVSNTDALHLQCISKCNEGKDKDSCVNLCNSLKALGSK